MRIFPYIGGEEVNNDPEHQHRRYVIDFSDFPLRDDLAGRCAAEFIGQETDEGKKPKTRLDWPAEFKDEVLAMLLSLNAERATAERAAGIASIPAEEDNEIEEEVDA
jgi:hypothetical protein